MATEINIYRDYNLYTINYPNKIQMQFGIIHKDGVSIHITKNNNIVFYMDIKKNMMWDFLKHTIFKEITIKDIYKYINDNYKEYTKYIKWVLNGDYKNTDDLINYETSIDMNPYNYIFLLKKCNSYKKLNVIIVNYHYDDGIYYLTNQLNPDCITKEVFTNVNEIYEYMKNNRIESDSIKNELNKFANLLLIYKLTNKAVYFAI